MRGENLRGIKIGGRKKGTPNKLTKEIKDMIKGALEEKGGQAWLVQQMDLNPVAFMGLLGRILPQEFKAQLTGSGPNGEVETVTRIERVIVRAEDRPQTDLTN